METDHVTWSCLISQEDSCCVLSYHVYCLWLNSCRAVRQHRQKVMTDDHRLHSQHKLPPSSFSWIHRLLSVYIESDLSNTDVTDDINLSWNPFKYGAISNIISHTCFFPAMTTLNVCHENICQAVPWETSLFTHAANHCYYLCHVVAFSFIIKPARETKRSLLNAHETTIWTSPDEEHLLWWSPD